MSGMRLTIPTSFTNKNLPILREDPLLPNKGALMLLEPGHPSNPWPVGVPASGQGLPNIARETAQPLFGAAEAQLVREPRFTDATGKLERSSKAGLHGITSQVNSLASVGATINLPAELRTYMQQKAGNDFYLSLWSRVTREPQTTTDFVAQLQANADAGGGYLMNFTQSTVGADSYPTATSATVLGTGHTAPRGAGGASRHSAGVSDWMNGKRPTSNDMKALAANWANGSSSNFSNLNKFSSWIFYRFYLEDLTVSGRTFAEVDALDSDLFSREVLTAGGRYYGDTFTNPSTLP